MATELVFLEMRFPEYLEYGMRGGPRFKTLRTQANSGYISGIAQFRDPLREYQVSNAEQTELVRDSLLNFFHQTFGGACGFRFKDWNDYTANITNGIANEDGLLTGQNTFQLYKNYQYSLDYSGFTRVIEKPVVGGDFTAYLNTVAQPSWSLDETTGIVTMTALFSKVVTAITKANPGVVTSVAHGFSSGDKIRFKNIAGMTQLNNNLYTITVLTPDTFSIGVNTTSYTTFVNDGNARAEIFPGGNATPSVVAWDGEFDVPVVFAEDYAEFNYETFNKINFQPRLIEIRITNQ